MLVLNCSERVHGETDQREIRNAAPRNKAKGNGVSKKMTGEQKRGRLFGRLYNVGSLDSTDVSGIGFKPRHQR